MLFDNYVNQVLDVEMNHLRGSVRVIYLKQLDTSHYRQSGAVKGTPPRGISQFVELEHQEDIH